MKWSEIRAFPLVSMKYRAKFSFLGPWIPSSNNREIVWYFDELLWNQMFPLEFLEYYGQYAFRILALRMAEIFQFLFKKSDIVRQFHNNSSSLVGLI